MPLGDRFGTTTISMATPPNLIQIWKVLLTLFRQQSSAFLTSDGSIFAYGSPTSIGYLLSKRLHRTSLICGICGGPGAYMLWVFYDARGDCDCNGNQLDALVSAEAIVQLTLMVMEFVMIWNVHLVMMTKTVFVTMLMTARSNRCTWRL